MSATEQPPAIRVGTAQDGSVTYLIAFGPEAMPPVNKRDLELAWLSARRAAMGERWGEVRGFRFARADGTHTDLMLYDPDAACWAAAIDQAVGLRTRHGLSVCLRMLALVELLGGAVWARPLVKLDRGAADLHPAILIAAATLPLTREARFDEGDFRRTLGRHMTGLALPSPSGLRH